MNESDRVLAELRQLREQMVTLAIAVARLHAIGREEMPRPGLPLPTVPDPMEQLVTLDQCAAIVGRRKRSLDRYRERMPPPRVRGGRGRASAWAWAEVRPWLEEVFGRRLPTHFPGATI